MRALLIAALFSTAACTDADADAERGPIGKADQVGSCAGTDCDGQAPEGNCWCDAKCAEFGDCCSDKVDRCAGPLARFCGGIAGLLCREGEYCHHEEWETCGAVDRLGTCLPIPEECIEAFFPVCGCDAQTYETPASRRQRA
jgi:hypothetical protein